MNEVKFYYYINEFIFRNDGDVQIVYFYEVDECYVINDFMKFLISILHFPMTIEEIEQIIRIKFPNVVNELKILDSSFFDDLVLKNIVKKTNIRKEYSSIIPKLTKLDEEFPNESQCQIFGMP